MLYGAKFDRTLRAIWIKNPGYFSPDKSGGALFMNGKTAEYEESSNNHVWFQIRALNKTVASQQLQIDQLEDAITNIENLAVKVAKKLREVEN